MQHCLVTLTAASLCFNCLYEIRIQSMSRRIPDTGAILQSRVTASSEEDHYGYYQLMSRHLLFAAALTAIHRHQLALLHIKLFFLAHHPLVKAMLAHALARCFFGGFAERDYITHEGSPLQH